MSWIHVTDALPELGEVVLVVTEGGVGLGYVFMDNDIFMGRWVATLHPDEGRFGAVVTAWQRLPEAPYRPRGEGNGGA